MIKQLSMGIAPVRLSKETRRRINILKAIRGDEAQEDTIKYLLNNDPQLRAHLKNELANGRPTESSV